MMTALEKLEQLETQLRSLIAERDDMKARLEQAGGASARVGNGEKSEDPEKAYNLLLEERETIRERVESLLAAISQLSKAS
jgi:hypothetical protein